MTKGALARVCAPLTLGDSWSDDLQAVRALGIGGIELLSGWAEAPLARIAALADALTASGIAAAVVQAPEADTSPEAITRWLALLAPLACHCLLLPPQPVPADEAAARAGLATLAAVAEQHGVTLLLENNLAGWPLDGSDLGHVVAAVAKPGLRACFDPAQAVRQKKHPFLSELMPGPLKRYVQVLRLRDAVFSDGAEVLPNEGNAELKECVSALECRRYQGWYALSPFGEGAYESRLSAAYTAARSLIGSL